MGSVGCSANFFFSSQFSSQINCSVVLESISSILGIHPFNNRCPVKYNSTNWQPNLSSEEVKGQNTRPISSASFLELGSRFLSRRLLFRFSLSRLCAIEERRNHNKNSGFALLSNKSKVVTLTKLCKLRAPRIFYAKSIFAGREKHANSLNLFVLRHEAVCFYGPTYVF